MAWTPPFPDFPTPPSVGLSTKAVKSRMSMSDQPSPPESKPDKSTLRCVFCGVQACREESPASLPGNCPAQVSPGIVADSARAYDDPALRNIAQAAARTESAGYCRWTRLEEIMEFAKRAGFGRLGIAFCVGLSEEARAIQKVFEENGFEVASVACKTGSHPKEQLGLADAEKVRPGGFEPMCNPAGHAMLLNAARTDLNVLVGLCVGHDSSFIKFSEAPVTVAVVKDRVLGHNPVAAIHSRYFRQRLKEHHR